MPRETALRILSEIIDLFQSTAPFSELESRFSETLSGFSLLLALTANDENERKILSNSFSLWAKIDETIASQVEYLKQKKQVNDDPCAIFRLRITRGIVLLSRNLIVGLHALSQLSEEERTEFNKENGIRCKDISEVELITTLCLNHIDVVIPLCMAYLDVLNGMPDYISNDVVDLYARMVISCFQLMTNVTNLAPDNTFTDVEYDMNSLFTLLVKICRCSKFSECIELSETDVLIPFLLYVKNIISHDSFLTKALKLFPVEFSSFFCSCSDRVKASIIDDNFSEDSKNQFEIIYISTFSKVLEHESFGPFLIQCCDNESDESNFSKTVDELMRVAQIVFGGKDNGWDNLQLTNICAWLLDYYHYLTKKANLLLEKPALDDIEREELAKLHPRVVSVLDCLSSLTRFDHVSGMLNAYKLLPDLIRFFRSVENNTQKKKLKDEPLKPGLKVFPQAKLIIVEIITSLVYLNFENQEMVRNEYGLELILNNCNLDTNEPYIKERAILCIKYLLLDNPKNQEFVRELEAKGTEINGTSDKVLEEAGYEIDIIDGKVKLKKTAKLEEIEENARKGETSAS